MDGSKYEGTWVHGNLNGPGRAIFFDGDYYIGNFVNNMMEGDGLF